MKKKVSTIVDIAKQLNISITTVSFILNGKAREKRISEELIQKVLKFIDEVGYRPNVLARSLRTGRSNIIGLLVEDISNPFFATVARLIEDKAYAKGYKIIYSSTDNDALKTRELISLYHDRQVDGYIIAPPANIEDAIIDLKNEGKPVVLFDRTLENISVDSVSIDGEKSTYNSVVHLVKQGYKRIGFVTLDSQQSQMLNRLLGYQKAISDFGYESFIKSCQYHDTSGHCINEIAAFCRNDSKLDAVIFSTNYLGIRGLKAIRSEGLSIPGDLGVIVFDQHDLFDLHTPSITSVVQPIEDLAEQAISILLKRLDVKSVQDDCKAIVLPATLNVRQSSKKN